MLSAWVMARWPLGLEQERNQLLERFNKLAQQFPALW